AASLRGCVFLRRVDRRVLARLFCGGQVLHVDDARPRLHLAGEEREVLAQREPLEVAGEVNVAQVGMALEVEAVHLPRLPLVPLAAAAGGAGGGRRRRSRGEGGLERAGGRAPRRVGAGAHPPAGAAAGVAGAPSSPALGRGGPVGGALAGLAGLRLRPVLRL